MARKKTISTDLVLEIISRFPEGASVEEVLVGLNPQPLRRTLQHHLALLVKSGQLEAQGKTRGRKFRLPPPAPEAVSRANAPLVLSTEGQRIQQNVTLPIQERKYVNYQRDFLDAYQPNRTFYLSDPVRKKLHAQGKTDGDRPAGTHARQIYNRLLIDLSWNSSRLEGNSYSLLETVKLLEEGVPADGKDRRETQMILNHKAAIEFLVETAGNSEINRYAVLSLHSLLADGLLSDAACGALRQIPVGIGGSVYMPHSMPQLVAECFQHIIDTAAKIQDPFEQAFFLMVHLPYLQPFEDVNKRVSRLAANFPLVRANMCPLSFIDVPETAYVNGLLGVYELNRVELLADVFVWAYERSCSKYTTVRQTLGEPDPFRMRYRNLRKETVAHVVREKKDQKTAVAFIRATAQKSVPKEDRARFLEVIESELMSLHEGNISRYGLKPSEYDEWQKFWR